MRQISRVIVTVLLSLAAAANDRPGQNHDAEASSQTPQAAQKQQQDGQPATLDLTEQVIRDVLEPLQAGLQSHRLKDTLSLFDGDSPDYAHVRDDLRAFFARYSDMRFRYKVLQLTSDKDRAFVTAEGDLEANPADENLMQLRRSTQMRLQLRQTAQGWKIAAFTPADFFEQQ